VRGCDAVVLMVQHDVYKRLRLNQLKEWLISGRAHRNAAQPVLVDGRHVFDQKDALAAGFVFRGVGVAP
jgi:UDP-N-acetyl-D-mannosaminuronate dehydrogenase